jgi:hypothetical protein
MLTMHIANALYDAAQERGMTMRNFAMSFRLNSKQLMLCFEGVDVGHDKHEFTKSSGSLAKYTPVILVVNMINAIIFPTPPATVELLPFAVSGFQRVFPRDRIGRVSD